MKSSTFPRFHATGLRWLAHAALYAMIFWSAPVLADGSADAVPGLSVEDAIVTPSARGGTARVRLRIENFSGRSVALTGARSLRSRSAVIVRRVRGSVTPLKEPIFIVQNEELDLRSSHLWIELRNVKRKIGMGDDVPLELIFDTGVVRVDAHAHPAPARRR